MKVHCPSVTRSQSYFSIRISQLKEDWKFSTIPTNSLSTSSNQNISIKRGLKANQFFFEFCQSSECFNQNISIKRGLKGWYFFLYRHYCLKGFNQNISIKRGLKAIITLLSPTTISEAAIRISQLKEDWKYLLFLCILITKEILIIQSEYLN